MKVGRGRIETRFYSQWAPAAESLPKFIFEKYLLSTTTQLI
jgi:hypothetical protein